MKIGLYLRNMGPGSDRATLLAGARAVDALPIDDLWVFDHLAIPPDDAEGSGGRYLEPLATLAFLAAATERVRLGTGVLVLPYRPALLVAKWAATIQELSGGRLQLGVASGWMEAEFRALGVPFAERGRRTDEGIDLFHRCFAEDEVEVEGQRFLFRPRPRRPPLYVGGMSPRAIERAAFRGDGWMPMSATPEVLQKPLAKLRSKVTGIGKPMPEVVAVGKLPLDDPDEARERASELAEHGVTRIAYTEAYATADDLVRIAETLAEVLGPLRS